MKTHKVEPQSGNIKVCHNVGFLSEFLTEVRAGKPIFGLDSCIKVSVIKMIGSPHMGTYNSQTSTHKFDLTAMPEVKLKLTQQSFSPLDIKQCQEILRLHPYLTKGSVVTLNVNLLGVKATPMEFWVSSIRPFKLVENQTLGSNNPCAALMTKVFNATERRLEELNPPAEETSKGESRVVEAYRGKTEGEDEGESQSLTQPFQDPATKPIAIKREVSANEKLLSAWRKVEVSSPPEHSPTTTDHARLSLYTVEAKVEVHIYDNDTGQRSFTETEKQPLKTVASERENQSEASREKTTQQVGDLTFTLVKSASDGDKSTEVDDTQDTPSSPRESETVVASGTSKTESGKSEVEAILQETPAKGQNENENENEKPILTANDSQQPPVNEEKSSPELSVPASTLPLTSTATELPTANLVGSTQEVKIELQSVPLHKVHNLELQLTDKTMPAEAVVIVFEKEALIKQEKGQPRLNGLSHTLPAMAKWVTAGAHITVISSYGGRDVNHDLRKVKAELGVHYSQVIGSFQGATYPREIRSTLESRLNLHANRFDDYQSQKLPVFILGADGARALEMANAIANNEKSKDKVEVKVYTVTPE